MQFSNIPKSDFVNTYKTDPKFQERVMDAYSAHLLAKYSNNVDKASTAFFLGEGKSNYYNQPSYRPNSYNLTVGQYLDKFHQGYNQRTGGYIMNKPEGIDLPFEPQMKMKLGGEYELTNTQIQNLRKQGYEIEEI